MGVTDLVETEIDQETVVNCWALITAYKSSSLYLCKIPLTQWISLTPKLLPIDFYLLILYDVLLFRAHIVYSYHDII